MAAASTRHRTLQSPCNFIAWSTNRSDTTNNSKDSLDREPQPLLQLLLLLILGLASALLQSILIISLSCFSLRSRSAPSPLLSYLFHDLLLCSPAPFERPLSFISLRACYRLPMCPVHVAFMRAHISFYRVFVLFCFAASSLLPPFFFACSLSSFSSRSRPVYCLTLPSVSCDVIGANIGSLSV